MKAKINRFSLMTSSKAAARPRAFRALLPCGTAVVLSALFVTANGAPPPPPSPPPDDYPPTTVQLSGNTTVLPNTAPSNAVSINVSTSTDFKGLLEGNPETGLLRVTDAHPAGTYTVTVTGFDSAGIPTAKTFTLTVTTPPRCEPVNFAASVDLDVGARARSVAIGDFNRDSKQDLAVVTVKSNNVAILLGDGSGHFDPAVNFEAGDRPVPVAVGDFNGDGRQDLAIGCVQSVSILLGDGSGGFSAPTSFDISTGPASIAVGDFNDDGKQDLATANFTVNRVSILIGDGLGGFSVSELGVEGGPEAVAVGSFNSEIDSIQDLVVINTFSDSVSVLLGDGAGNFNGTTFPSATFPKAVAVGNFDGDSKQDLAIPHFNADTMSVYLGDGAGSFTAIPGLEAGHAPNAVAIGDFNSDGSQDLAVVNYTGFNVSIFVGDRTGHFSDAGNFSVGSFPFAEAVGDFNGDGRQDLVVTNNGSNTVSVLMRQGCECRPIITHSTSEEITADNSVSCNLGGPPGAFHMDNSYWRAFDMEMFTGSRPSQQYDVTSVSFGIETAAAGSGATDQLVMVNLYTQTSGTFPGGTRTSILPAPIPVLVPNQTQTILNVPLETTVPAGTTELIMEVFTPNGQPDHNSFFIGSNTAAETGPSYLSAASCGITMPATTADLGFPNMHVVFNINGSCAGGTPEIQAINLSTRLRVQTGDNVGIGGFIITGNAPKHVLLRAIGPSLTDFGVPGALADPVLELNGPSGFVPITNNNWRDTQEAAIIATGIPPSNDFESAIDATLAPGAYTAIVRGTGNTAGVGLIELYDLNPAAASKLANISTRALVSTGDDIVIAGFTLGSGIGDDAGIVVRGLGPSLAAAGVPNALADPTLELRNSNGALLVTNNDWQGNPEQAAELIAAGLAPLDNLESGIAATLPPGVYTALLAGVNNGTGAGLVEVYDLGAP